MKQLPTSINSPEILTIPQAAARGVLPERALRRLVAEGKIPTIKSGGRRYISFTRLIEQLNDEGGALWR